MSEYRIFKYPLNITDVQFVRLPVDAVLLSVAAIDNKLYMWARVPFPFEQEYDQPIRIVGTGNPDAPAPAFKFLGTVVMPPMVWHVFDWMGG